MALAIIKGYDITLKGTIETPPYDPEKKDNGVKATFKILKNISYNKIMLYQEYTVCFQIFE